MDKIVYEVDIKDTSDIRIEYCEPVGAFTLLIRAHLVGVQIR